MLTSTQVSEWEAFDSLEPRETTKADYRVGLLCSTMVNIARSVWGKKGSFKATTPLDYMPNWDGKEEEPKEQTVEEMKSVLFDIFRWSKHKGKRKT